MRNWVNPMKLPLEYAVLGALMKRPMHGYDIHKFLSSALRGVWYVGMSNMYSILKKLESEGHVLSTIETLENRPSRRVFAITQTGEELFKGWISQPVGNIRDMRVEFIAKLYFYKDLGLAGGEELVQKQKAVCQEILDSLDLRAIEESGFARLLFSFKMRQIRSILSWVEECFDFLKTSYDKV